MIAIETEMTVVIKQKAHSSMISDGADNLDVKDLSDPHNRDLRVRHNPRVLTQNVTVDIGEDPPLPPDTPAE